MQQPGDSSVHQSIESGLEERNPTQPVSAPVGSHTGDLRVRAKGFFRVAAPSLSAEEQAHLEESLAERLAELVEGRTDRGVLVLPAALLGAARGLREFLTGLPPELASSVLVWQEAVGGVVVERADNGLSFFWGNVVDLTGYVAYLLQALDTKHLSVLGDLELARALRFLLIGSGVSVDLRRLEARDILESVGVEEKLLDRMDLERLFADLARLSGA